MSQIVAVRRTYSLDEAAGALGVSKRTIHRLLAAGTLSAVRIGSSRRRIPASELERLTTVERADVPKDDREELHPTIEPAYDEEVSAPTSTADRPNLSALLAKVGKARTSR